MQRNRSRRGLTRDKGPPRSYWRVEQARAVLEEYANEEGGSLAEFARRRGLNPKRLYRWRKRLAELATATGTVALQHAPSPTFLPVQIKDSSRALEPPPICTVGSSPPSWPADAGLDGEEGILELVFGGHRRIRVPAGFDASTLLRLVQVLEAWDSC